MGLFFHFELFEQTLRPLILFCIFCIETVMPRTIPKKCSFPHLLLEMMYGRGSEADGLDQPSPVTAKLCAFGPVVWSSKPLPLHGEEIV